MKIISHFHYKCWENFKVRNENEKKTYILILIFIETPFRGSETVLWLIIRKCFLRFWRIKTVHALKGLSRLDIYSLRTASLLMRSHYKFILIIYNWIIFWQLDDIVGWATTDFWFITLYCVNDTKQTILCRINVGPSSATLVQQ